MTTKPANSDAKLAKDAGLFSIRRAMDISEAKMEYIENGGTYPVIITTQGNRAVQSQDVRNEEDASATPKDDANNLVYGEKATLPLTADTLKISFFGKFLEITNEANSSDKYHGNYAAKIRELKSSANNDLVNLGFHGVAHSLAYNLANASWAWRNRTVAETVDVTISYLDQTLVFEDVKKAKFSPLDRTADNSAIFSDSFDKTPGFKEFVNAIEKTLRSEDGVLLFDVSAEFKVGCGAQVYPSQLFLPESLQNKYKYSSKNEVKYKAYSKELFKCNTSDGSIVAGLSPEKIGQPLRSYDVFHNRDLCGATSVEPNGASLKFGSILRSRSSNDFYFYKNVWLQNDLDIFTEKMSKNPGDIIFFIGNLVRGGVLGNAMK